MKSKINVYEIIEKHFSTLKSENKFIKRDKKIFFKYPIVYDLYITYCCLYDRETNNFVSPSWVHFSRNSPVIFYTKLA